MDFCTYEFFHYEARLMQLKLQIPDFVIYKEKIMGNFTIVSGENYWTIFENSHFLKNTKESKNGTGDICAHYNWVK